MVKDVLTRFFFSGGVSLYQGRLSADTWHGSVGGLHICGDSTYPGIGVPSAAMSGHICAMGFIGERIGWGEVYGAFPIASWFNG